MRISVKSPRALAMVPKSPSEKIIGYRDVGLPGRNPFDAVTPPGAGRRMRNGAGAGRRGPAVLIVCDVNSGTQVNNPENIAFLVGYRHPHWLIAESVNPREAECPDPSRSAFQAECRCRVVTMDRFRSSLARFLPNRQDRFSDRVQEQRVREAR